MVKSFIYSFYSAVPIWYLIKMTDKWSVPKLADHRSFDKLTLYYCANYIHIKMNIN